MSVNGEDLIFRLVGDMLGANLGWAQGAVRVRRGQDAYVERFWQSRGHVWRIERSDGLVFTDRAGVSSSTLTADGQLERGPSTGLTFTATVQMLRPAAALIWGRPGEDWRLTPKVSPGPRHGLWRVELAHTEQPERAGSIVVEEGSGILHQLHLDGGPSAVLEELELVNADRVDDDFLLR